MNSKRFRVIAPVFFNPQLKVGDVIDTNKKSWFVGIKVPAINPTTKVVELAQEILTELERCNTVFEQLGWWEDVAPADLPKYLRISEKWVFKVRKHFVDTKTGVPSFSVMDNTSKYPYAAATAATQEEYILSLVTGDKIASVMNVRLKGKHTLWHIEDVQDGRIKMGMAVQNGKTALTNKQLEAELKKNFPITKVEFTSIGTILITKKKDAKVVRRPRAESKPKEAAQKPERKPRSKK